MFSAQSSKKTVGWNRMPGRPPQEGYKKMSDGRPLVLVAPNAYKGSLSSLEAAKVLATGVKIAGGTPLVLPLADGGDGTLAVLSPRLGLEYRRCKVLDPLGRLTVARWGYNAMDRRAAIEMAQASGLALLKPFEQNPLHTTSYGTGQLIHAAVQAGAREIIIGLGGSATVDGGLGLLQALGARIYLGSGKECHRSLVGKDLIALQKIDVEPAHRFLRDARLRVLCDVNNPLLGPRGAARVFGPQKGASPAGVRKLEKGLRRLASIIGDDHLAEQPGTGAAGGLGAALRGFLRADLEKGVGAIFNLLRVEKQLKRANVVLTGEGRVDHTSWEGKALGELARLCRLHGKPIVVLAGAIGPGAFRPGVRVVPIADDRWTVSEKMRRAKSLLQRAAYQIFASPPFA